MVMAMEGWDRDQAQPFSALELFVGFAVFFGGLVACIGLMVVMGGH